MIKITRIISVLLILMLFTIILTACSQGDGYAGDYPELFSVAIGSILGARGYEIVGGLRGIDQPSIWILEEDNFGRVLFWYTEDAIFREISSDNGRRSAARRVFIYLVAQRVDGNYVYFYPHYNFIIRVDSGNHIHDSYFEDLPQITNEDLNALKEANSWNQEMSDDNAFERVRIVRQKESGPISVRQLAEAYRAVIPSPEVRDRTAASWMRFLRSDRYGRSVYITVEMGRSIVVIFQPDHSFNVETGTREITNEISYQTELRLLMEANGWNTPWVEP